MWWSGWLRWTDEHDVLIPMGKERAEHAERLMVEERRRAEQERRRAEQERRRAEQERQRAEQERQRAERLAALLRRSGIDPEQG